ncbi:MAG: DNA polymerase III subunit delta [Bacteroidetes bacterium]|nr:DNA polymerase III subunit delta [Bacteroidota bacterium]
MASSSYEQILIQLKNKKFSPLYFIFGEEEVFIDKLVEKFLSDVLAPSEKDFNAEVHDGDIITGDEILVKAKAYPLMSDYRVLIIKNFDKTQNLEILTDYFQNPAQSTILVLTSTKVDLRKNPFALLNKIAVSVDCKYLKGAELEMYIDKYLKDRKKNISSHGIDLLISHVGNSLLEINNALDKLILLKHDDAKIEDADISSIVGATREIKVFELTNFVGNCELNNALTTLEKLIRQGENPIYFIVMLTRHFTILWNIWAAKEAKIETSNIAAEFKIHPYYFKDYENQLKKYSMTEVENVLLHLTDADKMLKSTSMDKILIVELLLKKIISKSKFVPTEEFSIS